MRHDPIALVPALVLAAALAAPVPLPAGAAENPAPVVSTLEPSDPCTFYRGQAYGKGMTHFATEMLWACEAIAARRAARMPLGDRLEAAATAIEAYRAAVVAAAMRHFDRSRRADAGRRLGLSEAITLRLADSTGALVALEGIRTGF